MSKQLLLSFVITLLAYTTVMATDVTVSISGRTARLNNGIIDVRISTAGKVTSLKYNNGANLLGTDGVFYFSAQEDKGVELYPTTVVKKVSTPDYAEVVYINDTARIYKEQGFILRKGDSKLYTYVLLKGTDRTGKLEEARVAYRVGNQFLDAYVSDGEQGVMPSVETMKSRTDNDKIQDATYYLPDGAIYTKYDFANYVAQDHVHGTMDTLHTTGIWAIQANAEYVNGGPLRQDLTVHMDTKSPVICQYFHGGHFGGASPINTDNTYTKLFGPFCIYVNQGTREEMIADAKAVAQEEIEAWPYAWFNNDNYPLKRTIVKGNISIKNYTAAPNLQIVLSEPGVSDPYLQTKGYNYYTTTDNGSFTLDNVRPGNYSLYAYATEGEITDILVKSDITVTSDSSNDTDGILDLGTIDWTPTRYANLYWRIGSNDRTSDGFRYADLPRQYGAFKLCPADIDFTIGESDEATDWYYAQTKVGSWNIHFNLSSRPNTKAYLTLSVAAAARQPTVAIKVNGITVKTMQMDTNDGSIYRSAMRSGRHNLYTLSIPAALLKAGENVLTLNMTRVEENSGGIMWDCIKLESGNRVETGIEGVTSFENNMKHQAYFNLAGQKVGSRYNGIAICNGKKYLMRLIGIQK